MNGFPTLIPKSKSGAIPLHGDIGLDKLLAELHTSIPDSTIDNPRTSSERVGKAIDSWILSFERNPEIIAERQETVKYSMENPEFCSGVANLEIYPIQETKNDLARWTGMRQRFDSFDCSMTTLLRALQHGIRSKTLEALSESCEIVHEKLEGAKKNLDPAFELRLDARGECGLRKHHRGSGYYVYTTEEFDGDFGFVYLLHNLSNSGIKTGRHIRDFIGHSDHDSFLEYLKREIISAVSPRIQPISWNSTYNINGALQYDPEANRTDGAFRFREEFVKRKFILSEFIALLFGAKPEEKEGEFTTSSSASWCDYAKSILNYARAAHNYQIVNPFEKAVYDFEDSVVELKALATAARFLKKLKDKGYPLAFPEIVTGDSEADMYIADMYHPLLACFMVNGQVIPNDVETSISRNARIITGANNNGKTSYMDAIGLNQVLYQAGLPIIGKGARLRVKDGILTHYVRPGDIRASESRFAHECTRAQELIRNVTYNSLVLCDELFTGTAPQDGEAMSEMFLDKLIRTGATLFFTTHYHGLGDKLRDNPYIRQLCCTLDRSKNPPYTYKLREGISRDSDGIYVAGQFGVNDDNLDALLRQKARSGEIKAR